jgi:zinc and cadmium transporter
MLILILLAVFLAGILSLAGGVILLVNQQGKFDPEKAQTITALAVGVLLATACFDLVPEALAEGVQPEQFSLWFLAGTTVLFFLEKILRWYHHHHQPHNQIKPAVWLITAGDSLHNFLDGVAIAAAFLASPISGWTVSLAVFLHEIPHELVDFGILLSHGASRRQTLILNLLSACFAFLGAIFSYLLNTRFQALSPDLLAFAAGNFFYIALADLVPELSAAKADKGKTIKQLLLFALGIILIGLISQK